MIDFIGIGAEKAATSWMAECLKEHPEICYARIPEGKEIFYFNEFDRHYLKYVNKKYFWGEKWYLNHFKHCPINSIKGEISPTYLYSKKSAERIYKFNPNIKIIVMLRNPIERSISQYNHDISLGVIKNMSFEEAMKNNPTIVEKSLYYKYLKYYYDIIPKNNILVIFQEDIAKNADKIIYKTYKFLGVKNTKFKPESLYKKVNVTSKQVIPGLNNLFLQTEYMLTRFKMWWLIKLLGLLGVRKMVIKYCYKLNLKPLANKNEISFQTRRELARKFENDSKMLSKLIGMKLRY